MADGCNHLSAYIGYKYFSKSDPELQDCLAGASLPLLKGVENMVRFTGCSLGEAINMASGNVATVFGWEDRGALLPGKRADLLLFGE